MPLSEASDMEVYGLPTAFKMTFNQAYMGTIQ